MAFSAAALLLSVVLLNTASLPFAQGSAALTGPQEELHIQDVANAPAARFVPASSLPPVAEGNTPNVTWFRVRLDRAQSQDAWALKYTYKITRVEIYIRDQSKYRQFSAGGFDLANKDQALVPGLLALPESALHGAPFYVRVASVIDPRAITVVRVPDALGAPLVRRVLFGLFVGFFLTIGIFNFLLFLGLRDRSLLQFAGVMALQALDLAISFGVVWQLLPPISFLQRELIFDAVAMANIVALAAFAISFLRLGSSDRPAMRIAIAGTAIAFATVVVDFIQDQQLAYVVTFAANILYYGSLTFASFRAQLAGMRSARFFSAALCIVILGYVVNMFARYLPFQELLVFSDQAGVICGALLLSLAVAQQVQTAENLATRDGLTGVLNRRSFDDALLGAGLRASASGSLLGVLILDIDWFKSFNDRYGHQEGDACLIKVANACASCVRAGDVFARYGGEEFAAILPRANSSDLLAIGNRMREAVAALGLQNNGAGLSISVGGATATLGLSEEVHDIVKAADDALYRAKDAGRDRMMLSH